MGTPFRIPKLSSQSPLRLLSDDKPCKSPWTSSGHASKWNQDSQALNGNTDKPKSQINGEPQRWRPKRASDSLCRDDRRLSVGDSPQPQRVHGNGLLGKRKSSDSEEEFSWAKWRLPKGDKVSEEGSWRSLNGSQAEGNGLWHKKNGEVQGTPPTPTSSGNSSKQGTEAHSKQGTEAHSKQGTEAHSKQDTSAHSKQDTSAHSKQGTEAHSKQDTSAHSKQGTEAHSKQGTDTHSKQGTNAHSKQGTDAQGVPGTPKKTPAERAQPSSATGTSPSLHSGDQPKSRDPIKCPNRPPLRSPPQNPHAEAMKRLLRPRYFRTYSRKPKPGPIEPIVLSSDDEKGEEDGNDSRLSQSSQNQTKQSAGAAASAGPQELPSVLELPFAELHMGSLRAQGNGSVMITHEGMGIPLKGGDEQEVMVTVVASQLQRYGIWDGGLAQDGSLFPGTSEGAPSLLFLAVSEPQARILQTELMEIQHDIHRTGQASPFLLLVLDKHLEDLQAALLASVMDLIGLRSGQSGLAAPLPWAEGLELLHRRGQEDHLLALLGQQPDGSPPPDSQHADSPRGTKNGEQNPSGRGASQSLQPQAKASSSASKTWKTRSAGSPCRNQALPRRLIQYPPPPSKGGITVTTEDLACLKSGEFLNDVIIDFYLKYLLQERADQETRERSHIFSSFFYKQLTRKDTASEKAAEGSSEYRRHQRVRTWTRHVEIFNKDYIFVPVNQEAHWYLVVICFPGLEKPQIVKWGGPVKEGNAGAKKKGKSQASSQESSRQATSSTQRSQSLPDCTQQNCTKETICRRSCILVMDSLKLSYHERIYKLLRDYLQVEWKVRRGTPRCFTPDSMPSWHCRVPMQDNSSDCGLYLLQYVEAFLQNPVVHFELPLRLERWFPRQQVRRKREEIRELVLELYQGQGVAR